MRLTLSCACPPYDRVQALIAGEVAPEGIDLHFLRLSVEEIFWRQARHAEFDVSECSLSTYTMLRSRGDERFVAIPVFTSRFFRHSCIFINTRKGIRTPEDIRGRVVGLPEYQMTAPVWQRGIFQEEYGVHPREVQWRNGGEETPGRIEKVPLRLPPEIRLEPIPQDKTLSRMLESGEIDALFTAREPSCFRQGSPHVARLFPDYREVEERYFRKTGIFPIMHTVVIKKEVYKRDPWVAMNLFKAFCEAKDAAVRRYSEMATLQVTLPWLVSEVERTKEVMGADWWPYGIAANRKTLETFLRYHHEQGLSERPVRLDELFAPETMDEQFKV